MAKSVDVVLCPLRLLRDGYIEVCNVGGLQKRVTPHRALS